MEFREELKYSKSHEWVKEEGEEVVIGLTDYAQSELGDLVFVNLPEEGDELLDTPEAINEAPYDAWFVRVKEITDTEELLDAAAYQAYVENQ